MSVKNNQLIQVHKQIAACSDCRQKFEGENFTIICPPGLLYPTPLSKVTVLFVGVAPPYLGKHFYSDPNDGLRRGLFSVLRQCRRECFSVEQFHGHGFYLSHAAKCPIEGTPYPQKKVCQFCTSKHLVNEIRAIQPEAVCFLSKTTGLSSCKQLLNSFGCSQSVKAGSKFRVSMWGKPIWILVTGWPGRKGLADCRTDLPKFLNFLDTSRQI